MLDYRPGADRELDRPIPVKQRGGIEFGLIVAVMLACSGAFAAIAIGGSPLSWIALARIFGGSNEVADQEFTALYQRYGSPALSAGAVVEKKIREPLEQLRREACDKRAIYRLSVALEETQNTRGAATMLKGFGEKCPEASGETYRAAELFLILGDYVESLKQIEQVVKLRPDSPTSLYLRARALQGAKRFEEAIIDPDYPGVSAVLP